ncbi:MAG: hypothetical protein AAF571_09215 [Verrucomicrobiota bacterium]
MGHSFFAPVVKHLDHHAQATGFTNHTQFVVFHGGANGAPGKLWRSQKPDIAKAKQMIQSGTVDLVGLTTHYVDSTFEDYQRWINLALKHNPETIFIIQAPWDIKQQKEFATYEKSTSLVMIRVNTMIDQLRAEYPENTFLSVPQGKWMVELWRLFEQDKLPELTQFVASSRQEAQGALFRDQFGHAGHLAEKEGALLWLRVIYQIDLAAYSYDTGTSYDLKQLAQQLCDENPYSGIINKNE